MGIECAHPVLWCYYFDADTDLCRKCGSLVPVLRDYVVEARKLRAQRGVLSSGGG